MLQCVRSVFIQWWSAAPVLGWEAPDGGSDPLQRNKQALKMSQAFEQAEEGRPHGREAVGRAQEHGAKDIRRRGNVRVIRPLDWGTAWAPPVMASSCEVGDEGESGSAVPLYWGP